MGETPIWMGIDEESKTPKSDTVKPAIETGVALPIVQGIEILYLLPASKGAGNRRERYSLVLVPLVDATANPIMACPEKVGTIANGVSGRSHEAEPKTWK